METILFIFVGVLLVRQLISAAGQVTYISDACDPQHISSRAWGSSVYLFLHDDVASKFSNVKFYNATNGIAAPNKLYALFQCRGDLSQYYCQLCVYDAVWRINSLCTGNDGAVMWYEECMIRYAYRNIFSLSDTYTGAGSFYPGNFSNMAAFTRILPKCMDSVIKDAVHNGSHFATREMSYSASQKVHCMAQCTPDLDEIQCQTCLQAALRNISISDPDNGMYYKAMFLFPSCQLRYENQSFFHEKIPALDPIISEKKRSSKLGTIFSSLAMAALGIPLFITLVLLCRHLRKISENSLAVARLFKETNTTRDVVLKAMVDIRDLESLQCDFAAVVVATSNFSEENKLGHGGFGDVYKGKFSNGEEIAVKKLSKNSHQGVTEFKNEVLLLAKLQHRNLVKLLGFGIYCEEKILVYEYLSNSSLDRFLYDPLKREDLEWELRFRIIIGIARGLLYLHEDSRLKIIHRDLKASNILLDDKMDAKIADFGIARLFNLDQTQGDTMRIAGTRCYMAPEYVFAGHFSVKSDVYSFGVIVLEIMSGQRITFPPQQQGEGLLDRAQRLWNEDAILELIDPLLGNKFVKEEAKLCLTISLLCIQEDATLRPEMASIVAALNGQSVTLPLPNAPHIFTVPVVTDQTSSNIELQHENEVRPRFSDDEKNVAHTGPLSITDLYPR